MSELDPTARFRTECHQRRDQSRAAVQTTKPLMTRDELAASLTRHIAAHAVLTSTKDRAR